MGTEIRSVGAHKMVVERAGNALHIAANARDFSDTNATNIARTIIADMLTEDFVGAKNGISNRSEAAKMASGIANNIEEPIEFLLAYIDANCTAKEKQHIYMSVPDKATHAQYNQEDFAKAAALKKTTGGYQGLLERACEGFIETRTPAEGFQVVDFLGRAKFFSEEGHNNQASPLVTALQRATINLQALDPQDPQNKASGQSGEEIART